jgi:hypothetical protein
MGNFFLLPRECFGPVIVYATLLYNFLKMVELTVRLCSLFFGLGISV